MNRIFEINFGVLTSRYPLLAEKLKGLPGFASGPASAGAAKGEVSGFGGLNNPVNLIFLGLGTGEELVNFFHTPPPGFQAAYLVLPDLEDFLRILYAVDLSGPLADRRFNFLVGVDESSLFTQFHRVLGEGTKFATVLATEVVTDRDSYASSRDYYRSALKAYRDAAMDHLRIMGNAVDDSFIGLRNMLENLPVIATTPGVDRLFRKFGGKPAIIVAAGPSLEKNVDLLREVGDRAVIFAVDVVLKNLLKRGIKPHFVTVIERVENSSYFFQGLDPEEVKHTVQISVPVVMPDVYETYPGPKALMYRPYSHFKWLEREKGTLMTGASCANMAFKVAEAFGCSTIILIGQDLAYGEGGETHSGVVPWGKKLESIDQDKLQSFKVRGNLSAEVTTNNTWNSFRLSYERDVAAFRGRVVNATEGGAHISGTEVKTLREAIDIYVGGSFSPVDIVGKELLQTPPREAENYQTRLRTSKFAQTAESIGHLLSRIEILRDALSGDLQSVQEEWVTAEVFSLIKYMMTEPLIEQSVFHVAQPAIIQGVMAHYAAPSGVSSRSDIPQVRVALHKKLLSRLLVMAKKTQELYLPGGAKAEEKFAANLDLLEKSHPLLAGKLRKLGPGSRVLRVFDGAGGTRLMVDGKRRTFEKLSTTEGVLVSLGVDVTKEYLDALLTDTGPRSMVVLVERDLEVFREFLYVADLGPIMRRCRAWLLVGEITGPCHLHAEREPHPNLLTSFGSLKVLEAKNLPPKDGLYYREVARSLKLEVMARRAVLELGSPRDRFLSFVPLILGKNPPVSIEAFRGIFSGRAQVCLSGLSGDEAKLIAKSSKEVLTIASGESGDLVLAAGGEVHISVCPGEPLLKTLEKGSKTPLVVYSGEDPPGAPHLYSGPASFLHRNLHFRKWAGGGKSIDFPGFLGADAFALLLAAHLGCGAVTLSGMPQISSGGDAGLKELAPYWSAISTAKAEREISTLLAVNEDEPAAERKGEGSQELAKLSDKFLAAYHEGQKDLHTEKLRNSLLPALTAEIFQRVSLIDEHIKEVEENGEIIDTGDGSWCALNLWHPDCDWATRSLSWYKNFLYLCRGGGPERGNTGYLGLLREISDDLLAVAEGFEKFQKGGVQ